MFRIMRSFWLPDPEPPTKLRRRKPKNKKKKRNKAPNLVVENNLEASNLESLESNLDSLESNLENVESDLLEEAQLISADENQNYYYELEINEEQYQYMRARNYINENNECIRLEFPSKEDDPSTRNVLFEEQQELEQLEQQEQEKKRKKKADKWWMNDEEFDENFELTDEQKLKCAAFFVWLISLVLFFYFYNPEPPSKGSKDNPSSIDRIREMTRNRLPPGVLPHRNKFFPGMDDDPADHLSRYFDRNQAGRSPYDEPGLGRHFGDHEDLDEEQAMKKRMKRKRKAPKPKKDGIKRILWWAEHGMPPAYRNKRIFDYYACEKTNCEFLTDKSRLRESHAVVFDGSRLNASDMPSSRRKMQLYILYAHDAPQALQASERDVDEMKFNLSWSFTLDSSIRLAAGNLVFDERLINERNLKAQIRQLSRSRSKGDCLVVLANACKTIKLGGSTDLAGLIERQPSNGSSTNAIDQNATIGNSTVEGERRLGGKLNGEVGGKLNGEVDGKLNGEPNGELDRTNVLRLAEPLSVKNAAQTMTNYELRLLNELVEWRSQTTGDRVEFDLLTNCGLSNGELQRLWGTYRFVWIVENQSCKNNPNNQLYLALETPNTIPILNTYKQPGNLPHNSVINLNRFGSVSLLADYLQELKSNFTKFYSHLRWKRYFKVSYKHSDVCDLCAKLNEINHKNYKHLTAEFTPGTWKLNAACFTYDKLV